MSTVATIRGWLECDDDQIAQIKQVVQNHIDEHYTSAWAFPPAKTTGSWINFAFFGVSADQAVTEWLEQQLQAIAALQPKSPDEYIRGIFFVSVEGQPRQEWHIANGALRKTAASAAYDYLDS